MGIIVSVLISNIEERGSSIEKEAERNHYNSHWKTWCSIVFQEYGDT
jgi:hypothetical protein